MRGLLRNRYAIIVFAVLVAAAVPSAMAAFRAHSAAPTLHLSGSRAPSALGGGQPAAGKPKAGVAKPGNHPTPIRLSKPVGRHLTKAGSAVFDVRSLKSVVVKRERPERTSPFDREHEGAASSAPSKFSSKALLSSAPAPGPDSSFDGLDFANWGAGHPPDENGDVGPNYYIQTVNTSIGIYDKSNGNRVAAFTFNSFMSQGSFGNLCDTDNFGDPVVVYDSFEDRWVITDFAFKLDASGNVSPQTVYQCFAVSKTGDPVSGGWNYYSILAPGGLADYPKFGVWSDGLYMSANMFGYSSGGSYFGYHVWALNKQQMYAGAPTVQIVDFAGDTSDFTVIPANARLQAGSPPAGSPEYFVSTEQFLNALSIYKFQVNWDKISTSTFTGPFTQAAPTCWPNSAVANASTPANAADTLSIRAMAQAQYSNLGGAESLWVDHTVNRGEFTIAACGGTNTNNATIRWYQANVTGGTVAANAVQGATFDPEAANTFFRFMPSLAVDHSGDLAIGYTKSNSTTNPQIKYAGRLAADPANTLGQSEQTLIDGTGSQSGNCGPSTCVRWGDYSGMALDPNGCEFWMTGEYYATSGLNDQTRIGSFHYPGCSTVGNGTLSGTVTAGGNPVSGATVTLGSRTTTTNGSGAYSFTVPAGTYASVTADKAGFNQATASTIAVPDGGTATRNLLLTASAQSGCFTDDSQTAFQRGVPANCDLVKTPGSVVLANPDNTDAKNSSVSPTGFGFSNTSWAGQTFTPTVSGQLKRVDVELFCSGCSAAGPNITLSIRATTGATPVPTGADLGSATIAGFNDGAAGGLHTFTFASPVSVTAGTRYAFVFRNTAAFASGTMAYTCSCATTGFSNTNPYASGQRVTSTTSGSTWSADTTVGGRDLNFVTYINPGFASSGTFVSSLKDANPNPGSTPKWTTLSWTATTPASTGVKFQVAGSNNPNGPFNFVGPGGTASTFFTTSGASLSQFDGFRYLKYEAFLSTTDGSVTPTLSSVVVCYTDAAATAPTSVAVDPATGTFGGTTTLSATLTSGGSPVSGKTVSFTLNGSPAGSAVTNGSGVASESGVSLAGINAGTYPTGVVASFAGDPSFDPSNNSGSLTVNKADQAINFGPLADKQATDPPFTVSATGGASGNPVTFSTASTACSVTGSTVTILSNGTCAIDANQAGSSNYNAAPQVTQSFSIGKTTQTITFPAIDAFTWSGGSATLTATASSGLAVSYSVLSGPCSVTGSTLTANHAGSCVVAADQAGNGQYSAAAQQTQNATVNKADQTITVTTHAPSTAVFNTQFTVAATGGASGSPVTFTNGGVCSNSGATFTMTSGTGTCSVKVDQAGDSDYNAATQVVEQVTAQKANQAIIVTTHAPATAALNSSFDVAANAPGGVVGFSSAGSCSNSGTQFTMTSGSGTCSVKYDQGGDANYNAAPQVTENVSATKGAQAINVTTHAPASAVFGTSFGVAATGGGSGNPVTVSTAGTCSNTGTTVTMTSGTGTCTVKYDQAGDSNYDAAPQVTESVTAQKAAQAINVTTHAPATAVFGSQFSVAATGGASGNAVTFSNGGVCSNTGATFTMTSGTGTCTVKYDQAGDSNYNAAPQVSENVTAQKANQTITVITHAPATAAYGSTFGVSGSAPGGVVLFTSAGNCTNSGSSFTMSSGTGSCTVKYDQAGSSNYNAAPQVTETTNATTAPLTITANDRSKAQGTTLALGTTAFSTGGLVGGDGISSVTLTSAGAASGAAAGTYPIVASNAVAAAGTSLANYTVSYVDGTLTVTAATGPGPKVTISRPVEGGTYKLGQSVTSSYKCAAVNKVAVASCVGDVANGHAIDTSTVGAHTFTVVGTDVHGNTTTVTHHYSIRYAWQGFIAPIQNDSVHRLNLVQAGNLIRLDFSLDGDRGLDVLAAGSPDSVQVTCPNWSPQSQKAAPSGTPSGLFFNATAKRYGYGWQTDPAWAGTCRQFSLSTNDGTAAHTATFKFFQ